MSATHTNWRGMALNDALLKRSYLPLFNPWANTIALYHFRDAKQMSARELEEVWKERGAIGDYLRRLG